MSDNVRRLEVLFADTEACIDLAAETAVDEGMSLRAFIDSCLRAYKEHRRKKR